MEANDLKQQLDQQGKMLAEIRDALLGSLDGSTVGLIADHRTLKQTVDAHGSTLNTQSLQIGELQSFRKDAKKVIAVIAFSIPFAFEIVKGLLVFGWEYLKNITHK